MIMSHFEIADMIPMTQFFFHDQVKHLIGVPALPTFLPFFTIIIITWPVFDWSPLLLMKHYLCARYLYSYI